MFFVPSNNATIMFLSLFIILHTCEKQTSTEKKNKFFLSLLYDLLHKKHFYILNKFIKDTFFIIAVLPEQKHQLTSIKNHHKQKLLTHQVTKKCFRNDCSKITKCFMYFTVSHFVSDTTRRTYCTS